MTSSQAHSSETLLSSKELADKIIVLLNDKKAQDIVLLDVHKKSTFADYFIIASGHVGRQMIAIAEHLLEEGKKINVKGKAEGLSQAEWILVDFGDVVVHLFKPDVRERYGLEKMWASSL